MSTRIDSPVGRALWYIDSHLDAELSLEDIASCAGVSRFHLLRAFGTATGCSIMEYTRGRRLSEAARRLAQESGDILSIALGAGYGSHEAFTRAFRDQFGVTPQAVSQQGHTHNLLLVEALAMNQISTAPLQSPRFEDEGLLLMAGLSQHYACDAPTRDIPGQWQRFAPYIDTLRGRMGTAAYGVCHNFDESGSMEYLCAVQVADVRGLPPQLSSLRVLPQHYVVFTHSGHVSAIRGTWNAIWNEWLPQSSHRIADAPFFERYDERFDPRTGNGGMELWVPLAT